MDTTQRLGGVSVYGVSIRFREADLTVASSTSITTSLLAGSSVTIAGGGGASGAFNTGSSSVSSGLAGETTEAQEDPKSGLTSGAKVGIAVGAAMLVLVLTVGLCVFVFRGKRFASDQSQRQASLQENK